jgi:hypothetical protein
MAFSPMPPRKLLSSSPALNSRPVPDDCDLIVRHLKSAHGRILESPQDPLLILTRSSPSRFPATVNSTLPHATPRRDAEPRLNCPTYPYFQQRPRTRQQYEGRSRASNRLPSDTRHVRTSAPSKRRSNRRTACPFRIKLYARTKC